jgi:hypothetical protein
MNQMAILKKVVDERSIGMALSTAIHCQKNRAESPGSGAHGADGSRYKYLMAMIESLFFPSGQERRKFLANIGSKSGSKRGVLEPRL